MDTFNLLDSSPTHLKYNITDFFRDYGETVHFKTGQIIAREGEMSQHVFVLLDGKVNIVKTDSLGNDNVIATAEKGAIFGEMSVFLDQQRSATLVASGDVKVLSIANDNFSNALMKLPDMMFRIFKTFASKLSEINDKYVKLVNNRTMIATGMHLLAAVENNNNEERVTVDIKELTEKMGLDLGTTTAALTNYKRLNLINEVKKDASHTLSFNVNTRLLKSYVTSICTSKLD
jgi:CRP-like cAMP-binding protein